ncbi:MAG: LytTR family transcriptional regulator DNA-binding domain-containing protein, partial [Bacteroidota bacterium]
MNKMFFNPSNLNAVILSNINGTLAQVINNYYPKINLETKKIDTILTTTFIERIHSDLIFIDVDENYSIYQNLLHNLAFSDSEIVVVTSSRQLAYEAARFSIAGFLLKPIDHSNLVITMNYICRRIKLKKEHQTNHRLIQKVNQKLSGEDLIGIPTIDGLDFIQIKDIVRCKGLQRCTQVVTTQKSNVVSSYNLGEFKKILEPFHFFSPHKSHLINLKYIKK